jgi:hypothetical protein
MPVMRSHAAEMKKAKESATATESTGNPGTGSHREEKTMKYICLGYLEPGKFEGMTEDERHRTFDECFEYNDHLRSNGHLPPKYLFSLRTALTPVLEKRQSRDDRRPLRGNQGTAWRHSNP